MVELITHNRRNGVVVNSTALAKHLGIRHQDLMRKVKRIMKSSYVPKNVINDKYCKGGKRDNYMFTRKIIVKLGYLELIPEMDLLQEKIKKESQEKLDRMFGGMLKTQPNSTK